MRHHQEHRGLRRLAGLLGLLLIVSGIGFAGGAGSAASAAGTVTVTVNTSLSPKDITVAPGTTVIWKATGGGRHKIESTSGPVELKSDDLEPGTSWSFAFAQAGTYAYVDKENDKNAAMHGSVTVRAGATNPGTKPGAPAPPAPKTAAVSLANKAFSPSSITVAIGGTVTWTNNDSMPHNVTAVAGAFASTTLNPGGVFKFTFTKAGTYAYLCTLHGGMNGTVVVPSATGAVPPPPGAGTPAPAPVPVPAAPGRAGKHIVTVSDTGFSPATLNARAGDTVTWVNRGASPHTATAAGGAFNLSLAPGASASTILQAPGRIAYVCSFHSYMTGTIIVGAALPGVVIGAAPAGPKAGAAGGAGTPVPAAVDAAPGRPGKHIVTVTDTGFSPATLNARAGDTVTWVNRGAAPHTATAAGGAFDLALAPGASASTILQAPGRIAYVCTYHPYMTGTIIVAAALPGTVIGAAPAGPKPGALGATAPKAAAPVSTGASKTIEIKVAEMTFTPAMVSARVGDTISWVNVGKIPHTVTAKDGSFDKTPLAPGERFNYVLRKVGTINYTCTYHPGMDAMLMVGAAPAGVAVPADGAAETKAQSAAPASKGLHRTYEVLVKDNSFTPADIEARVGDTISWVNLGRLPHTVTARDHSFDKTLKPGQRFNLVLKAEGTIAYVCTPHPGMFGVVTVGPALPGSADGPPMTLAEVPTAAMASVGTGWLLLMSLLAAAQLRVRRAAVARRGTEGSTS